MMFIAVPRKIPRPSGELLQADAPARRISGKTPPFTADCTMPRSS